MNKDLVRIIENPVILQNLCTMRDKNTDSQGVRIATRKITRMLLYEASKNLPLVEKEIERLIPKLNNCGYSAVNSRKGDLLGLVGLETPIALNTSWYVSA